MIVLVADLFWIKTALITPLGTSFPTFSFHLKLFMQVNMTEDVQSLFSKKINNFLLILEKNLIKVSVIDRKKTLIDIKMTHPSHLSSKIVQTR